MLHNRTIVDFAFSADSDLMASLDADQARVWHLVTGKLLKSIDNTHGKPFHCVLFSNSALELLVASLEIHVVNLKSGVTTKMFRGHQSSVNQMYKIY
jgi:WD40 repeat protein